MHGLNLRTRMALPSVAILMRHFPTLQTLWANRSLNHGRNPQESSQFGFKHASHHLPALQPQREIARRRGCGPLHLARHQNSELGLLLWREGLISSHWANWRRWRLRVHPTLSPKNKPPTDGQIRHEKQRLESENARPWKSRWRAAPLRSRLRLCEWSVP